MSSSESPHRTRSRQSRAQKRKHNDDEDTDLHLDLGTRLSEDDKYSTKLLRSVFMRISPHIWWKILPNDEQSVDTFTFSSGQRWEYCLPLLMEQGLVRKKDGKIEVITNEWDTFGMHAEADMTLHHTFYRPRTGKKVWYVCRGVPTHK